jgi:hypothetical protein
VVFAIGITGMQKLVQQCRLLGDRQEFRKVRTSQCEVCNVHGLHSANFAGRLVLVVQQCRLLGDRHEFCKLSSSHCEACNVHGVHGNVAGRHVW